jgi:anti-sigma regulatory factor (Ser/Thr protein kinase)
MDPGSPKQIPLDNQLIEIEVPIVWEYVRRVRQQVEAALAHLDEDQRSAAVMVASELLENAIKYGVAVPPLSRTRVTLQYSPTQIEIRVDNGLIERGAYERVRALVESMSDDTACERLYLARIQELIDNPFQKNQLGLYRIGYEGKFSLSCNLENQVLSMTARRNLP